jgi:hypothetical protein
MKSGRILRTIDPLVATYSYGVRAHNLLLSRRDFPMRPVIVPVCLALLGLASAGVVASAMGQPQDTPTAPAPAPAPQAALVPARLVFDPPLLDLGALVPEVPTVGKVKIRNVTDAPIRIVKAVANCSCTKPNWPTETIPPGATAETEITMTPGVQQGVKLTKVVTFEIAGGGVENYTVQGDVGLFMKFEPESLKAPATPETDTETPAVFTLESVDGTPFKVVSIEPAIGSSSGTEPALTQTVTIDWAKWREQKRPIKVAIKTDHPKAPTFSPVIKRTKAAAAGEK